MEILNCRVARKHYNLHLSATEPPQDSEEPHFNDVSVVNETHFQKKVVPLLGLRLVIFFFSKRE